MNTVYRQLAQSLLALLAVVALGACTTAPVQKGDALIEPKFSAERLLDEDITYLADDIWDPWEGFNRTMFRFNYRFDKYIFLPVVNGYQAITPDFMERGIHNFFLNINDIRTFIHSVLQASPTKTVQTTGRFVVNSTLGLLGFFDVATKFNIPKHDEDFGQTLGYWGVGNGPFLVLPILGPSNVRDGVGKGVDFYVMSEIRDGTTDLETWHEVTWDVLNAIDTRANIAFRYFETGSPFEYEWVRLLYTTKRRMDIER